MDERIRYGIDLEGQKENDPLVVDVYRLALGLLATRGTINTDRTMLEFRVRLGLEVTTPIRPGSLEFYGWLADYKPEYGSGIEARICKNTDLVCISFVDDNSQKKSLELSKFDPGQQRTIIDDLWKLEPMMKRGVMYHVRGETTAEELKLLVSMLKAEGEQVFKQETPAGI
jgi:hypothetical protein